MLRKLERTWPDSLEHESHHRSKLSQTLLLQERACCDEVFATISQARVSVLRSEVKSDCELIVMASCKTEPGVCSPQ